LRKRLPAPQRKESLRKRKRRQPSWHDMEKISTAAKNMVFYTYSFSLPIFSLTRYVLIHLHMTCRMYSTVYSLRGFSSHGLRLSP
jgi:hypothetical protein